MRRLMCAKQALAETQLHRIIVGGFGKTRDQIRISLRRIIELFRFQQRISAGFLFIAFELHKLFKRKRPRGQIFSIGVVLVVVGMLGQTAGGWVGRIPLDFFKSCY